MMKVKNSIKDRLLDKVIPFADDPFGNYICFDYRKNNSKPDIIFWDHELINLDPEKGLFFICDSFDEFLSKFY